MTARDPLYLAEAEIADRIGIDRREWPSIVAVWEKRGFPPIKAITGKRYWPAVRAWLDRDNRLAQDAALATDGEEDLDYVRKSRPRTRPEKQAARV